jgi:HK97 gp10 family phage protein
VTAKIVVKYNRLPQIAAKFPEVVRELVQKAARDIEANAKASMEGQKHGRIYTRGGVLHQASAPGEAPAVDTGKLKSSIFTEMVSQFKAVVTASAEYAAMLEFGTRRMAARPFFRPAAEKIAPAFFAALQKLEARLK